jgi:preprotein translocase subunit SecD
MRSRIILALVGVALLAAGCSEVEPKTGTRVTFEFESGKPIAREQLAATSKYLTIRGGLLLGVRGPRVDEVSDYSITLLLPGKKVPRAEVDKLIEPYSIELYHLSNVATAGAPNRLWKIKSPSTPSGAYLFIGPDARRIDSRKDPQGLLAEVVGVPHVKPVLTGRDILPAASHRPAKNGWAVLIKFTPSGAKTFYEFTKSNRGEYLAVFYNGRLVSAPVIKDPIPDGEAYVTGFAGEDQARAAASGINAGTLPGKVKITGVEYY